MGALDLAGHLLSFVLPASTVAVAVAFGARWLLRAPLPARWWVAVAINFIAGVVMLAAGLWYFGRDGKMATYAAMVFAIATAQWLAGRAWR